MYLKNTPPADRCSGLPLQRRSDSAAGTGAVTSTAAAQPQPTKRVAILLCTYNGSQFLAEQLASIAAQDYSNWTLEVSDDGSTDDTLAVLDAWHAGSRLPRLAVASGPARGFVANFLSLAITPSIVTDYYAFADQDDVWEKDKLSRAIAWLDSVDGNVPALYCSRTRLVDSSNSVVGLSPLFTRMPCFANALVQSIAGGNTVVFNEAARRLLVEADVTDGVVSHDWWLYLLVTGCGGSVNYDPHPAVRYRQHGNNLVGANGHWRARHARLRQLLGGAFRIWCSQHIVALKKVERRLTPENRSLLLQFSIAREKNLFQRLVGFARCGIHRQTLVDNLGLFTAAIFKKI